MICLHAVSVEAQQSFHFLLEVSDLKSRSMQRLFISGGRVHPSSHLTSQFGCHYRLAAVRQKPNKFFSHMFHRCGGSLGDGMGYTPVLHLHRRQALLNFFRCVLAARKHIGQRLLEL